MRIADEMAEAIRAAVVIASSAASVLPQLGQHRSKGHQDVCFGKRGTKSAGGGACALAVMQGKRMLPHASMNHRKGGKRERLVVIQPTGNGVGQIIVQILHRFQVRAGLGMDLANHLDGTVVPQVLLLLAGNAGGFHQPLQCRLQPPGAGIVLPCIEQKPQQCGAIILLASNVHPQHQRLVPFAEFPQPILNKADAAQKLRQVRGRRGRGGNVQPKLKLIQRAADVGKLEVHHPAGKKRACHSGNVPFLLEGFKRVGKQCGGACGVAFAPPQHRRKQQPPAGNGLPVSFPFGIGDQVRSKGCNVIAAAFNHVGRKRDGPFCPIQQRERAPKGIKELIVAVWHGKRLLREAVIGNHHPREELPGGTERMRRGGGLHEQPEQEIESAGHQHRGWER
ncbi:MAG: hypothetical protein UZ07_CHB004001216 [Chlorobi bacterium OLB7]|nr:MAG: hypothetical protein UZ07_CHB004001216 [Chlorobi bacterium OLB7]